MFIFLILLTINLEAQYMKLRLIYSSGKYVLALLKQMRQYASRVIDYRLKEKMSVRYFFCLFVLFVFKGAHP